MKNEEILKEFTPEKVGERIKGLQIASGYSVREISEQAFLTTAAIYKILNGRCIPKTDNLVFLSLILNTTIDYILLGR